jgi:hypothetical protein
MIVGFGSGLIGAVVGVFAIPVLGFGPLGRNSGQVSLSITDPQAVSGHFDPLPVNMRSRPSKSGKGAVLQLQNVSMNPLTMVSIVVEDGGTNTSKRVTRDTWPTGEVIEIGENDGWNVALGQHLLVQASEYAPLTVTLK